MHYSAGFDIRFSLTCSITSSTVLPVIELIWSVLLVNCGDSFPGITRSERFHNVSSATAIMGVLHFLSKQAFYSQSFSPNFVLSLQFLHWPQSRRMQALHSLHLRIFFWIDEDCCCDFVLDLFCDEECWCSEVFFDFPTWVGCMGLVLLVMHFPSLCFK